MQITKIYSIATSVYDTVYDRFEIFHGLEANDWSEDDNKIPEEVRKKSETDLEIWKRTGRIESVKRRLMMDLKEKFPADLGFEDHCVSVAEVDDKFLIEEVERLKNNELLRTSGTGS